MAEGPSNDIQARFLQPGIRYVERESNLVCYVAMQDDISVQFSIHLPTKKITMSYTIMFQKKLKHHTNGSEVWNRCCLPV